MCLYKVVSWEKFKKEVSFIFSLCKNKKSCCPPPRQPIPKPLTELLQQWRAVALQPEEVLFLLRTSCLSGHFNTLVQNLPEIEFQTRDETFYIVLILLLVNIVTVRMKLGPFGFVYFLKLHLSSKNKWIGQFGVSFCLRVNRYSFKLWKINIVKQQNTATHGWISDIAFWMPICHQD